MASTTTRDRSLRDGNGRTARLARWLAQSPTSPSVDTLVLESRQEGEWQRLQCWPIDRVSQLLASEIDELVVSLANELGAYVQARVAWWSSSTSSYWTEHALRVQPEDMGQMVQAFSGDQTSIAIQNQRHQEHMAGAWLRAVDASLGGLKQSSEDLRLVNSQVQSENLRLREELQEASRLITEQASEIARLTSDLEQAIAQVEEAAQAGGAKATAQHEQVIGLITTALQGHFLGAGGKAS